MPKYIVHYDLSAEIDAPTHQAAERELLSNVGFEGNWAPHVIETSWWSEKVADDEPSGEEESGDA